MVTLLVLVINAIGHYLEQKVIAGRIVQHVTASDMKEFYLNIKDGDVMEEVQRLLATVGKKSRVENAGTGFYLYL